MILLLVLAFPASAWEHLGYVWSEPSVGIEVSTTDPPGLAPGVAYAAVEAAAEAWVSGSVCTPLVLDVAPTEANDGPRTWDGLPRASFEDPDDDLPAGVYAVTYAYAPDPAFTVGDVAYTYFDDADIVFNDSVNWLADADISADCVDGVSIQGVATYSLGILLGLAPTCDDDDLDDGLCTDAELVATLGRTEPLCSTEPSTPEADDFAGLDDLYTVPSEVSVSPDAWTAVPATFTVDIVTLTPERLLGVSASWDDGVEGTVRTFEEGGLFVVEVCPTWDDPTCGGCERTRVVACEDPVPTLTHEEVDAGTHSFVGDLDSPTGACYQSDATWRAERVDTGAVTASGTGWSFVVVFEESGTYRVVLEVLDIDGDAHLAEQIVEVLLDDTSVDTDTDSEVPTDTAPPTGPGETGAADDPKGCGCASTPAAPASALAAALALTGLLTARRRTNAG